MRKTITAAMTNEIDLWGQGHRFIMGIDEAGRGAWAGPVAAGAVCLPNDPELSRKLAGVRDSKQMTPRQRERLIDAIKEVAITWGIGWATPQEIDQINILRASCLAMVRAYENALENAGKRSPDFKIDYLLVDSIKCPEFGVASKSVPARALVKGDQHCLSIAAASILAKTWRDDYMRELDKQHSEYEFAAHKGYGTSKHQKALKAFGPSPHHRMTFKPIRQLQSPDTDRSAAMSRRIIQQIDHLLILVNDPDPLYALFKDTFQLPVVWPMTGRQEFASGGLCAGNVDLEILRYQAFASDTPDARLLGIAFEPTSLETSMAALDERKISHGAPMPAEGIKPNGQKELLWTNVVLENFLPDSMIFLCARHIDYPARRARGRRELNERDGGPLGIEAVKEVVIGVRDLESALERWGHLLSPIHSPSKGLWTPQDGPAVRLVEAAEDGLQSLVIKVKSLERARHFLSAQGMPGDAAGQLSIARDKIHGLDIRLVEA